MITGKNAADDDALRRRVDSMVLMSGKGENDDVSAEIHLIERLAQRYGVDFYEAAARVSVWLVSDNRAKKWYEKGSGIKKL